MFSSTRNSAAGRRSVSFFFATLLLLPLAGAFAWAQDEAPAPSRVTPWIEDLGSSSLERREQAWNKLRGLGPDARSALEAAEDHADVSVRFSVRRLLERLDDRDSVASMRRLLGSGLRGLPASPPAPLSGLDLNDPSTREFEEDMRAWQSDLDRWFEQLLGGSRSAGPGWGRLGGGLPSALRGVNPKVVGPHGPGQNATSSSRAISIEIAQDGSVKVWIQKDEDGDTNEEMYEAPSLDAFREQYPEVASDAGLRGLGGRLLGHDPWGRLGRRAPGGPPLGGRSFQARGRTQNPIPDGPMLGVQVQTLSEAQPLTLDNSTQIGHGLLVAGVQPATLASRLGIQVGDVLVTVAGRSIGSPEDVRAALLAAADSDRIQVTVLRGGEEKILDGSGGEDLRG